MGKTIAEMTDITPERVIELANDVKELCESLTDVTAIPAILREYADREGLPTSEIIFLGMTAENILAAHRKHQAPKEAKKMNAETQRIITALEPIAPVIKGAIAFRMRNNTPARGQLISENAIRSYVHNNYQAMGLNGMSLECICWAEIFRYFKPEEEDK